MWVLRSAARLIGGIPKFGHVSKYMLDVLHWLPAEQRISYRIASLVWRSLVGLAPLYLRELCCPPLSCNSTFIFRMSSRSLRSSHQGLLLVPFAHTPLHRSALSLWWAPRPGTASLLNSAFLIEPFHLCFFLTLRLLCLTVLALGVLLSVFLEEALYK